MISDPNDKIQDSQHDDQKQSSIKGPDTEELLGSVTTFPTSGNDGPAVRTSARVIHKLRTPIAPPEKKEAPTEAPPVNPPKTPSQTKVHVRVQWNNAERTLFFDALNEYGRDFEQISRFINLKMRRKTPTEVDYKTKDHIRQIYYQQYQKASKYLCFSEDVKKPAQELYTLINYGEMKRKMVMSKESKAFLKLRDLVYKGAVTIRLKGKNIKVKTPSCRALRKLNQLEGNTIEDVNLPQRIDVNLRPVNMKSWGYVQGLAQNPRIRMVSLPLQKRVASLLHTLQMKWQTNNSRAYNKYVTSSVLKHGPTKIGEDIVAQSKTDLVQLKSEEQILRFMPPRDTDIHRPMVQLNELLSSCNICLNSYEDRIGAKTRGETLSTVRSAHIKDLLKHPSKRMRFDSASERNAKAKADEQNACKIMEEIGIAVIDHKSNDSTDINIKKEIKDDEIESKLVQSFNMEPKKEELEEALVVPTAPNVKDENDNKSPMIAQVEEVLVKNTVIASKPKKKDLLINGKGTKEHQFKPLIDEETLRKVRKGWTLSNVGDLTVGDLYLMFGSDSRLHLEYNCIDGPEAPETNGEANECKIENKNIGNKLKNLLSIANLMEGSTNPMLTHFLSNHTCERSSNDNNHEPAFKQPILNMNPGIKSNQLRWWKQHRPRQALGNQLMAGVSGNHVIRDLYQTPPPIESQSNKKPCDKEDESVSHANNKPTNRDDEVTKIIEAKIQNISGNVDLNLFSDNTRSSMRSILENLMTRNEIDEGGISDGE